MTTLRYRCRDCTDASREFEYNDEGKGVSYVEALKIIADQHDADSPDCPATGTYLRDVCVCVGRVQ